MPQINAATDRVPKLLTQQLDDNFKDMAQKAVARYIREKDLTPKQFVNRDFMIRQLLPYLREVDEMWIDIPAEQFKTTEPRRLV